MCHGFRMYWCCPQQVDNTSLHHKHCSQDSSSQAPGPHQHHPSWSTTTATTAPPRLWQSTRKTPPPRPCQTTTAAHSQPLQYASHATACSACIVEGGRAATEALLAMHAPLRQVTAPMADDSTGSMGLQAIKYRGTQALPKSPTHSASIRPALRTWSDLPAPVSELQGAVPRALRQYKHHTSISRAAAHTTYKHKQGHKPHNKRINTQPHPAGWPWPG